MSMEIINGYVCFDCTDVARAKKGEGPAAKPTSPNAKHEPLGAQKDDEVRGVNRPLAAAGNRGTKVNLLL